MRRPGAGVETLRAVGDRLQAKLGRLDENFRAACEAGRYAARSVALTPPAQTRGWTLWHLAFLGAATPAVDGLVPSQFSKARLAPEGAFVIDLAAPLGGMEERTGWRAVERMLRGLREWVIERSSIETADRVLPDWYLADLADLGEGRHGRSGDAFGRHDSALRAPPTRTAVPERPPRTTPRTTP